MKLIDFYERHRPVTYETNWHHRWICDVIERAHRERKYAIIELPPRHGKSEIANIYAPAWSLGENPDALFGLITNSDSLAGKFSVAARNLVQTPLYQKDHPYQLEQDRNKEWKIATVSGGIDVSYRAAGIRGQITGHGFTHLTLDDLLKSGTEAKSDVIRENVWENIASAAINRLTPDGVVVAFQARLHADDPVGKLLQLEHLKFLHLHLPATNDDGRSAWFRDGYSGDEVMFPPYSALWASRYSREKLDEIKATVTPYYWNAQYAQVPSLGDLAYFDVERFGKYEHHGVERCWIAVDAANTETKSGSFTAYVCLGLTTEGHIKVVNVRRGRWRQDVMAEQLLDFHKSCARLTGIWPEAIIIERAAAGYGLIDHFDGQLPVVPIYPQGSKEDRAGSVCYVVNRGKVLLPESAPWLSAFRDEVANFPLGSYNDQVDAFVHALSFAARPSEFKFQSQEVMVYEDPSVDYYVEALGLDGSSAISSELDKIDNEGGWE
ncbi:MAG TPA: phage terminase large subunit [Terriglobales bacterium]